MSAPPKSWANIIGTKPLPKPVTPDISFVPTGPYITSILARLPTPGHSSFADDICCTLGNYGDYREIHIHRDKNRAVVYVSVKELPNDVGVTINPGTDLHRLAKKFVENEPLAT